MDVQTVDIKTITPYASNPRRNSKSIGNVADSIKEYGWRQPIVVDEDMVILAGHTRHAAAKRLKLKKVPVHIAKGLTPAQAKAYRLMDNRSAQDSSWDMDLLGVEIGDLLEDGFDLPLTGFTNDELNLLLFNDGDDSSGADDVIPDSSPEVCGPGDVWILGDHKLMCGDCRSTADMSKLFGDTKINIALTSPPYASQRVYDEDTDFKPIAPDDYSQWFEAVQKNICKHLAADGSFFVNIKEHCQDGHRVLYVKELAIAFVRDWKWTFVDEYVWTHGGTPMQVVNRFKNGFEPVFHFSRGNHKFRPDAVRHKSDDVISWQGHHPSKKDGQAKVDKHKTVSGDSIAAQPGDVRPGLAYPSNVLRLGKNVEHWAHGAMFPVLLPSFFISAYTDEGDVVFDPFIGSGTTLIAAEKLDRRGFGMEISPKYCDVVIDRWQRYTKREAKRA